MLGFSSTLLREVYQAQEGPAGPAPGDAELCWGREEIPRALEERRTHGVFAHGVNGSGKAGAPRAAEQEGLRALALVRLALKVTWSWHDKPPHKCVLECSHHSLSSPGFVPVLKSRLRGSTCVERAGWGPYLPGISGGSDSQRR